MQNELFNSIYENSLRILLLLSIVEKGAVDRLASFDFIATYGKCFGLASYNLHGDNEFMYSEFNVRRKNVQKALKELVLKGMVKVEKSDYGFIYILTNNGKKVCEKINNCYAIEYIKCANKCLSEYGDYSDEMLLEIIIRSSRCKIRG